MIIKKKSFQIKNSFCFMIIIKNYSFFVSIKIKAISILASDKHMSKIKSVGTNHLISN